MLTIGSAIGCLLGMAGQYYFPDANISLPLAALVGMAGLFAGAARALLTSIVFAMETTMQESTLLPLIAGCVSSYMISFIFMRSTIMTEKIQRRGVKLPESYLPDPLEMQTVAEAMNDSNQDIPLIKASITVQELKDWLMRDGTMYDYNTILIVSEDGRTLTGAMSKKWLFETNLDNTQSVSAVINSKAYSIYKDNSVQLAVEFMLKTQQDILPVVDKSSREVLGVISGHDVLRVFEQRFRDEKHRQRHISMRRSSVNIFKSGKRLFVK